jgi:hypothetical protein
MRSNSGKGKSKNNLGDPTLKEHEADGGHRAARAAPGEAAVIGRNARRRGEDPSPDDRARGETSVADSASSVDVGTGR